VYSQLIAAGYRVALAAPTGKAAKRISEATGIKATTMHRLLEFSYPGERDPKTGKVYGTSEPKRCKENPLEYDVVLGDEYAMVNRDLHRCIIDALPPAGRVVAFGDLAQLPPIESSPVYRDMPSPFTEILERFPSVRLNTIHRQSKGSTIVENASRILKGFLPRRTPDFDLRITDDPIPVLTAIVQAYLKQGVDFSKTNNQIIVPMNISRVGSHALNGHIRNVFETTETQWIALPRHSWDEKYPISIRVGSKVIYGKNDYQINVFNGETGIVTEITEYGEVAINLGDRTVVIPPRIEYTIPNTDGGWKRVVYDPRKEIYLAYVLTTHKSQGSEYEHVIYLMNRSMYRMQVRSNLYTGITRARFGVALVTDSRSLSNAVTRERVV
jgi:exodeoxyribonuclease V alpha subunit